MESERKRRALDPAVLISSPGSLPAGKRSLNVVGANADDRRGEEHRDRDAQLHQPTRKVSRLTTVPPARRTACQVPRGNGPPFRLPTSPRSSVRVAVAGRPRS